MKKAALLIALMTSLSSHAACDGAAMVRDAIEQVREINPSAENFATRRSGSRITVRYDYHEGIEAGSKVVRVDFDPRSCKVTAVSDQRVGSCDCESIAGLWDSIDSKFQIRRFVRIEQNCETQDESIKIPIDRHALGASAQIEQRRLKMENEVVVDTLTCDSGEFTVKFQPSEDSHPTRLREKQVAALRGNLFMEKGKLYLSLSASESAAPAVRFDRFQGDFILNDFPIKKDE